MAEADTEAVMKAIHDPGCVFLQQHLTPEGVDVIEPWAEIPMEWEFMRQLPEKKRKTKVKELIMMAFDHLSEAHAHIILCHQHVILGKDFRSGYIPGYFEGHSTTSH